MSSNQNIFQKLYSLTIDRSKFREISQRYTVFILPLFFWGRKPEFAGLVVVAIAVLIRAWAAGYLKKDQELACTGPYVLARHPLYLGSCLLALGLIITLHHWLVTILLGGITFLTYNHTIRHEEKNLTARFGSAYVEFSKNAGPLWPKPSGLKMAFENPKLIFGGFSFKQYMKNKEYECLLGVLAVFAILYLTSK